MTRTTTSQKQVSLLPLHTEPMNCWPSLGFRAGVCVTGLAVPSVRSPASTQHTLIFPSYF